MKADLVHLSATYGITSTTEEGQLNRKVAASLIRAFRRTPGTTVTRVLRTSHVVIRRPDFKFTCHLTWAESEQRVQARLAAGLAELEWRRSVL
jgi:hypothetical protein